MASDRVGPVAEPLGGRTHALAPLDADLRAAPHHERHERARYAGLARHIVHRHVRAPRGARGLDVLRPARARHAAIKPLERSNGSLDMAGHPMYCAADWSAPSMERTRRERFWNAVPARPAL